jgi:hypothetical protein
MNDVNQLLLNMMMGARAGRDTRPLIQEMLDNSGDMDPMTRLLLTQTLADDRRDDADERPDDGLLDADDSEPSRRQHAIRRLRARFEHMTRQIAELSEELETLQRRNDDLAAALGACYLCWGEDPQCQVCAGQGRPGSVTPERELYNRWITPAVRAAQALRRQRPGRHTQGTQTNQEENSHG